MTDFAFMIDMDGVLYRGTNPIPEAIRFLEAIRKHPHIFLTNNSSETPESVVSRLKDLGIPTCPTEHILTSAIATADYLGGLKPGFGFYAVGGPGLHAALHVHGHEDDTDPDYVVIGEGEGLDYRSLTAGINILLRGKARLIGTNPDANLDGTLDGRPVVLPGGGALVAPFHAATGMKPLFVGKPSPVMFEQGLKRLGKPAGEVIMIGDRPDTDIKGAAQLGISTILVCTGRFSPDDPYPEDVPRPDLMVSSLAELDLIRLEAMVKS